jgi:2-iminobutanoate/2-iminopropanoate deaminase
MPAVPVVPISQHRSWGDLVFSAGQIGAEADGSIPAGFERQAELAFDSLEATLADAGSSLAGVLKATVFIADRADFAAMNEIYAARFAAPFPARTTIVTALVLPELRFEIEVVAARA